MKQKMRKSQRMSVLLLALLVIPTPTDGEVYTKNINRDVVVTEQGKMKGIVLEMPKHSQLPSVVAYLGIQYASTMGSDFRFMPPTYSIEKWTGEYLNDQIEDCLSLNIYVPKNPTNSTYAVMVFIHGESYDYGSGNTYDGSVLASAGNVIVVTLNYRLGSLGYLTTKVGATSSANHALMDLVAALQWVHYHIGSFGGDKGRVTLFGHGHGAALANFLSVSTATKDFGLFQRLILQSGTASAAWAYSYDLEQYTRRLAQEMNCTLGIAKSNDEQMVYCLKHKTASELANAKLRVPKYLKSFAPSADGTILSKNFDKLAKDPMLSFGKVDLMIGVVSNEGYTWLNQTRVDRGIRQDESERITRTMVQNIYKYHRQKIYDILSHYYADWKKKLSSISRRDQIMQMIGDCLYVAPMTKLAKTHSMFKRTYAYVMDIPSPGYGAPRWAGSIHGQDLMYVFGAPLVDGSMPFTKQSFSEMEKMYSEAIITYWTNFAKTGDPNAPMRVSSRNRFANVQWPTYNGKSEFYLSISERPAVQNHYRSEKVSLWNQLIPKIYKSDPNVDPKEHQLNNHNNRSTFEPGTRFENNRYFPPPPVPPMTPPPYRKPKTKKPALPIRNLTTILPLWTETSEAPKTMKTTESFNKADETTEEDKPMTLMLSIIIAVGCALLFLNMLIVAAIYYHRDKVKRNKKRKAEQERQRLMVRELAREAIESKLAADSIKYGMMSHLNSDHLHSGTVSSRLHSPSPSLSKHSAPPCPHHEAYHCAIHGGRTPKLMISELSSESSGGGHREGSFDSTNLEGEGKTSAV